MFVTRQYACRNFILTLVGGLFGLLLTLPIMIGISFLIRGATLDFIWNPTLHPGQWCVLISVPFALAVLAFLTTIKTVLDYLKRFL